MILNACIVLNCVHQNSDEKVSVWEKSTAFVLTEVDREYILILLRKISRI